MSLIQPLADSAKTPHNPLLSLKTLLDRDLKGVDEIINRHLESSVSLIPLVGRYLIQAGGKRLRPLLTLASYRLFREEGEEIQGLAAAVEFIHTATLLHDDVVDDSRLRRGLLTANEVWGDQASILVGDFLFARSFQLMIESKNHEVLKILATAAASIAEGEVLQLSVCRNLEASAEEVLRIAQAKTAELFAAACQVGALMAGHQIHAETLRTYGQNLGIAFQIIDDIRDYGDQSDHLGKYAGDDFREGKITLPLILAYPRCTKQEKDFFKRALIDQNQTSDDFTIAKKILHERGGVASAYDLAHQYGQKALQPLRMIPDNPVKALLADLIPYCLHGVP